MRACSSRREYNSPHDSSHLQGASSAGRTEPDGCPLPRCICGREEDKAAAGASPEQGRGRAAGHEPRRDPHVPLAGQVVRDALLACCSLQAPVSDLVHKVLTEIHWSKRTPSSLVRSSRRWMCSRLQPECVWRLVRCRLPRCAIDGCIPQC